MVVDIGAAPGSWSQVAVQYVFSQTDDNSNRQNIENSHTKKSIQQHNINRAIENRHIFSEDFNHETSAQPLENCVSSDINSKSKIFENNHESITCTQQNGLVLGIDLKTIHPLEGAIFLNNSDITQEATKQNVLKILNNRRADVVLCDISPQATGVRDLDNDTSIELLYNVLKFSIIIIKQGGTFLTKVIGFYDSIVY